jgi:thiol:disulfide interchange protein DsbD
LAAVVFVMGLSFLGIWELPIPGFAGRGKASELAAQEGATGAFVKGALTTILATPCSAPFLAPALTWAVVQPPLLTYAVLLSAGLGMASPYLLIGAFPQLIRFLPKPGAWMDTFKQLMGFVLLGTVVFIFTFLEMPLVVPAVGLLFGLWAACWWIGRISPLADAGAKARAWLEAAAFAGVVWILMFAGLGHIVGDSFTFGSVAGIMRERFDRQALVRAAMVAAAPTPQNGTGPKTVMVDFTADWCLTCKTLETTVLNTAAVADAVKRNGVVTLQADWTHEGESPEVTKMLQALGSKQVPVVAIFPAGDPNHPVILRGGYTQQMLLDALAQAGASE